MSFMATANSNPIPNFTITEWNSDSNNRNRYCNTITTTSSITYTTDTVTTTETCTSTKSAVEFKSGSSTDIGHYRLQRVLNNLDEMATLPSPRSPKWNQALYSPIQNLPTTRFPNADERYDFEQLH